MSDPENAAPETPPAPSGETAAPEVPAAPSESSGVVEGGSPPTSVHEIGGEPEHPGKGKDTTSSSAPSSSSSSIKRNSRLIPQMSLASLTVPTPAPSDMTPTPISGSQHARPAFDYWVKDEENSTARNKLITAPSLSHFSAPSSSSLPFARPSAPSHLLGGGGGEESKTGASGSRSGSRRSSRSSKRSGTGSRPGSRPSSRPTSTNLGSSGAPPTPAPPVGAGATKSGEDRPLLVSSSATAAEADAWASKAGEPKTSVSHVTATLDLRRGRPLWASPRLVMGIVGALILFGTWMLSEYSVFTGSAPEPILLNLMYLVGGILLGYPLYYSFINWLLVRSVWNRNSGILLQAAIAGGGVLDARHSAHRQTLLHLAAQRRAAGTASALIRTHIMPTSIPDALGRSPLHYAVAASARAVVTVLLAAHDCDLGAADLERNTPLHLLPAGPLTGERLALATTMLIAGAPLRARNAAGIRPVDIHPELRVLQTKWIRTGVEAVKAVAVALTSGSPPDPSNKSSDLNDPHSHHKYGYEWTVAGGSHPIAKPEAAHPLHVLIALLRSPEAVAVFVREGGLEPLSVALNALTKTLAVPKLGRHAHHSSTASTSSTGSMSSNISAKDLLQELPADMPGVDGGLVAILGRIVAYCAAPGDPVLTTPPPKSRKAAMDRHGGTHVLPKHLSKGALLDNTTTGHDRNIPLTPSKTSTSVPTAAYVRSLASAGVLKPLMHAARSSMHKLHIGKKIPPPAPLDAHITPSPYLCDEWMAEVVNALSELALDQSMGREMVADAHTIPTLVAYLAPWRSPRLQSAAAKAISRLVWFCQASSKLLEDKPAIPQLVRLLDLDLPHPIHRHHLLPDSIYSALHHVMFRPHHDLGEGDTVVVMPDEEEVELARNTPCQDADPATPYYAAVALAHLCTVLEAVKAMEEAGAVDELMTLVRRRPAARAPNPQPVAVKVLASIALLEDGLSNLSGWSSYLSNSGTWALKALLRAEGIDRATKRDVIVALSNVSLHAVPRSWRGKLYIYDVADDHDCIIYEHSVSADPEPGASPRSQKSSSIVVGATLEKLVESMTSHEGTTDKGVDPKDFLLVYRSFVAPRGLFMKLIQRFYIPLPAKGVSLERFDGQFRRPVQLRVMNLFKLWVERHWEEDFKSNIVNQLIGGLESDLVDFLADITKAGANVTSPAVVKAAAQVTVAIANAKKGIQGSRKGTTTYEPGSVPAPVLPKFMTSPISPMPQDDDSWKITDIDAAEIARQICLVDGGLFAAIPHKQLLRQVWTKKNKAKLAPDVVAMIGQFNRICGWVTTTIVTTEDLGDRSRVVRHWLAVTKALMEYHNYNGVMAVTAGLNSSPVWRLKKTWDLIPSDERSGLEAALAIVNPSKSFSALRNAVSTAAPPALPYLGMYLTDLTFLEDGNKDTLNGGLINYDKYRRVASVISEVQKFQQYPYGFTELTAFTSYIRKFEPLDEEAQFDESMTIEPRH